VCMYKVSVSFYLSVVGLLSLHCVGTFSAGLDNFDLLV